MFLLMVQNYREVSLEWRHNRINSASSLPESMDTHDHFTSLCGELLPVVFGH